VRGGDSFLAGGEGDGADQANAFLTRRYREPFFVPAKV
jgi:hypothetical protein